MPVIRGQPIAMQRRPEMDKAAPTLTNHDGAEKGIRRTIGNRQPPILLLDLEFIGESAGLWVLRVVHLCFLVW